MTLGLFSPLMLGVVHPVLFSGWFGDGAGQGGGPPAEVGTTRGSALEPPCQLCHLQSGLSPGRDETPWVTTSAAAVDNTYFGGEDHFQSFSFWFLCIQIHRQVSSASVSSLVSV